MSDTPSSLAAPKSKPKPLAYPLQAVTDCLLAELTLLAEAEANMQGLALPQAPSALRTMTIRLDSLTVVEVTCALEPVVGFELKNIVRTGGYDSIDAALAHMLPRIEAAWRRKNPGASA